MRLTVLRCMVRYGTNVRYGERLPYRTVPHRYGTEFYHNVPYRIVQYRTVRYHTIPYAVRSIKVKDNRTVRAYWVGDIQQSKIENHKPKNQQR